MALVAANQLRIDEAKQSVELLNALGRLIPSGKVGLDDKFEVVSLNKPSTSGIYTLKLVGNIVGLTQVTTGTPVVLTSIEDTPHTQLRVRYRGKTSFNAWIAAAVTA